MPGWRRDRRPPRQSAGGAFTGRITDLETTRRACGRDQLAWRTEGQAIPELVMQHLKLGQERIRSHITQRDHSGGAGGGRAQPQGRSGNQAARITYLLSRPLLLVTRSTPARLQKQLAEKHGFVPYQD
jgi:hypothetical protein